MKRTSLLFLIAFSLNCAAQLNFTVSTPSLCAPYTYSVSLNAQVTNTVPGTTSYTWTYQVNSNYYNQGFWTLWHGGGTSSSIYIVSWNTPGTLTITCSAMNGSTVIATTSNTVLLLAAPVFTVSSNTSTNVCAGNTLALMASGASSYSWFPGGSVGSSVVITPTVSQTYTAFSTGSTGCVSHVEFAVNVATAAPVITLNPAGNFSLCEGFGDITASGAASYTWSTSQTGNVLWLNSLGCYSVMGSNGCGTATAAACATGTYAAPGFTVSGPTQVCSGTPVTLSVTAVAGPTTYPYTTYFWSGPGNYPSGSQITDTLLASTCYTVSSYNSFCGTTTMICVNVPQVAVTGATVCEGSSATMTATGATTYTWSTAALTNTVNVLPLQTITYTVAGSHAGGCVSFTTAVVSVDSTCSDVWPGDANSDGTVDLADVLELGLNASSTGAARIPGGNSFVSQRATVWSGSTSTGKNKCHSDCDGNGAVNANDTMAIFTNFSMIHSFRVSSAADAVDPDIYLTSPSQVTASDSWARIDVMLGSTANPAQNVYGVSFELSFESADIQPDSLYLLFNTSFLSANNQNLHFRKNDFAGNKVYAARVRTDGTQLNGSGKIAELHFKIKQGYHTLEFAAGNARKMDQTGQVASLSSGGYTLSAVVPSGIAESQSGKLALVPNPASDKLELKNCGSTGNYVIADISGRTIMTGDIRGSAALDVSGLAPGTYLVETLSSGVRTIQKLVVAR